MPAATGRPRRNGPRQKPRVLGPVNRSPWFLRWNGPALTGRTAVGRGVRTVREDTGPTNDRTLPDTIRRGVTADGERTSGPVQVPRAVPAPGDVPSPAVFPRRRTPVLRLLPLIIVIISHRAIKDPCHQLHLGRLQTASHRPVIMREDERAPIGRVIRRQREGAGLFLYLRWGEGEGEEPRRRGSGERDRQGRGGRVECCRPSDELLSLEISRWSHRERLAGGDRRRVGDEESGDAGGRLTLARCRSEEDLSLDLHGDVRYCQLILNRSYAEPVTPLGRQRDSAAAASRGPCSQE